MKFGKQNINKNGVVKDIKIHKKIVTEIVTKINEIGFKIINITYSPIKGPAGNIEYLLYIEKTKDNLIEKFDIKSKIEDIVESAFNNLK